MFLKYTNTIIFIKKVNMWKRMPKIKPAVTYYV